MQAIIDYATKFANAGFHVFPLLKNNHNERGYVESKGWSGNRPDDPKAIPATKDIAKIQGWSRFNLYGYGICAWKDFIIIDLDMKKGKDGIGVFKQLKIDFNIPKPILLVKTKTGGAHLFYRRDPTITDKLTKATNLIANGVTYEGVDTITDEGYVVGPTSEGPSDWAKGKYTIINGSISPNLPILPANLTQYMFAKSANAAPMGLADAMIGDGGASITAIEIIKSGRIPDEIECGERDNLLMILIGVCKAKSLPRDTTAILTEQFIQNCELDKGESIEQLRAALDVNSKLDRIYSKEINMDDPREIARELRRILVRLDEEDPKQYMYMVTEENCMGITPNVPKYTTHLKNDLARFSRVIDTGHSGKVSTKPVNPLDIVLANWDPSQKSVAHLGLQPIDNTIFNHPVNGKLIYNTYKKPFKDYISKRSGKEFVQLYLDFVEWFFGKNTGYMMDWIAHQIQKPHIKIATAPVLISTAHGVGKNVFIDIVSKMIGEQYFANASMQSVTNEHFNTAENLLIQVNELQAHHQQQRAIADLFMEKLKDLITEPTTMINPKFKAPRSVPVYANFVLCTNNPGALKLSAHDRRFVVCVIKHSTFDQKRFSMIADVARNKEFDDDLRNDFIYALREHFAKYKIKNNLATMHAGMSDDKKDALVNSMPPRFARIYEYLQDNDNPGVVTDIVTSELIDFIGDMMGIRGSALEYLEANLKEYGVLKRIYTPKLAEGMRIQRRFKGLEKLDRGEIVTQMNLKTKSRANQNVYTIRNHDKYHYTENKEIRQMYTANIESLIEVPVDSSVRAMG